ncbi:MAG: class I SAM-dependent methyltransferase [Gammaproteobacteria bacterium]|nr:class I SAM-dependent methyltransferase [Gammaproteobacteria bacterium]
MAITKLGKFFNKRKETKFFKKASTEEVFTHIYDSNKWGDEDSVSGKGSNLKITEGLREALPGILKQLDADSMLDIPCGDFHWMKEIELPLKRYWGADIVKPLIKLNQRKFSSALREFVDLDLMHDPLPSVDVIFCRECLVHLSYADIAKALDNIKRSDASYLITTDFPEVQANSNCVTGNHHSLNFSLKPFNWPEPIIQYVEYNTGKRRGNKCLSVWKIGDIPAMSR